MLPSDSAPDVSVLLEAGAAAIAARDELMPLVYEELRRHDG
jgi:hypothetical protein